MKDLTLLNELELKIREIVSTLEKEREKKPESENSLKESSKLSEIEEKIKNLMNLIDQLEQP